MQNNLKQRVITALILIPLVIIGIFYLPTLYFIIIVGLVMSLAAWEWSRLAGLMKLWHRAIYIFALWILFLDSHFISLSFVLWIALLWWLLALYQIWKYPQQAWFLSGLVQKLIIGLLLFIPCWRGLQVLQEFAAIQVVFVLTVIWAADIGAYFSGWLWGKHKLAPKVSPKKTIEGLVGGLVFAIVIAIIFYLILPLGINNIWWTLIIVFLTVLFSVVGDLFISVIKRIVQVKDSGNLLPGHGGILDRIDSMTAAIPIFVLLLRLIY